MVVGSVLGSVTVLMFVIIMITTILLFMWWRYRKRSRSLGNFYYHLHYSMLTAGESCTVSWLL